MERVYGITEQELKRLAARQLVTIDHRFPALHLIVVDEESEPQHKSDKVVYVPPTRPAIMTKEMVKRQGRAKKVQTKKERPAQEIKRAE